MKKTLDSYAWLRDPLLLVVYDCLPDPTHQIDSSCFRPVNDKLWAHLWKNSRLCLFVILPLLHSQMWPTPCSKPVPERLLTLGPLMKNSCLALCYRLIHEWRVILSLLSKTPASRLVYDKTADSCPWLRYPCFQIVYDDLPAPTHIYKSACF